MLTFLDQVLSHQRTLQSKDCRRSCLLQRLHPAPPPAPPKAVCLLLLQVEPQTEQWCKLPALPLCFIWTLLQRNTGTHARTHTLQKLQSVSNSLMHPCCHLVSNIGEIICSNKLAIKIKISYTVKNPTSLYRLPSSVKYSKCIKSVWKQMDPLLPFWERPSSSGLVSSVVSTFSSCWCDTSSLMVPTTLADGLEE